MKKIIKTGLALIILFSAMGCKKFLVEDLKTELAPTNTYTSTYGFEVGSAGLYALTRSEYNTFGEGGAYIHNGACPYEALQAATDIADVINSDASLLPFANLTLNSSERFVGTYWNWAYSIISSANLMLIYSEKNTNWDSPSDKERFQAEARFFRAYAYRTLVYLYGDVPYVETILYDFKLNFTRTPKAEVLGHIIDDLTFASQHLPANPDQVKDGKLTKWAAYHLLSEMHLLNKAYVPAEQAALAVINSGYYGLMKTRFGVNKDKAGDVFSDLFLENNQNRLKNANRESIWVLQFEFNTVGGGTNSDDWSRRAWSPNYSTMTGFVLADTLGGRGLAQLTPMKWWVGTAGTNATGNVPGIFEATDIRNSNYNIKRNWYYNNPGETSLYGKKANITEQTWFSTKSLFPAITKFFYGRAENLGLTGSYKDRVKFRLAETYLLLAEAYLGQGNLAKAADAVNEVRKRAGASVVGAGQMTMDFLLDERIRELVGEESRRFTLVRTNKLVDRVKLYNTAIKGKIMDYHALWPIPQSIIDANRDAVFPQNPGYGK
ncbi:Starch-binding protein SusD [Pedobacter sp. Bi27]|uniref:RagB/SusD family nutrient uptake outer membrane protein n=1 Tax=unclassified Pedobacter TaxID=2628915 RepID=UPI001E05D880|nr:MULTISPECIES: RagB/SusD family nutrient uptake outer membrane protein [unclassified Pedobacter]CAH0306392.1 Starch-binding protein SusD [Pedobacter sp. Bi36]CAH0314658.1 Starch-binding protein SusD [Pedobacter sp. Bi27]CAH0315218.1 Starch-binding protein SusD [Pedobacter sp. Bi126]